MDSGFRWKWIQDSARSECVMQTGGGAFFKTNTYPPVLHAILEGLETDSAKSSLGLLSDLIEGHVFLFFFEKKT